MAHSEASNGRKRKRLNLSPPLSLKRRACAMGFDWMKIRFILCQSIMVVHLGVILVQIEDVTLFRAFNGNGTITVIQ